MLFLAVSKLAKTYIYFSTSQEKKNCRTVEQTVNISRHNESLSLPFSPCNAIFMRNVECSELIRCDAMILLWIIQPVEMRARMWAKDRRHFHLFNMLCEPSQSIIQTISARYFCAFFRVFLENILFSQSIRKVPRENLHVWRVICVVKSVRREVPFAYICLSIEV